MQKLSSIHANEVKSKFAHLFTAKPDETIRFRDYYGKVSQAHERLQTDGKVKIPLFENQVQEFDKHLGKELQKFFTSQGLDDNSESSSLSYETPSANKITIVVRIGVAYFKHFLFKFGNPDLTVSDLKAILSNEPGFGITSRFYGRDYGRGKIFPLCSCFQSANSYGNKKLLTAGLADLGFDPQTAVDKNVLKVSIGVDKASRGNTCNAIGRNDFVLKFDAETLAFLGMKLRTKESNLNVITGKGLEYSGDGSDIFDFRFQLQVKSKEDKSDILASLGYSEEDFCGLVTRNVNGSIQLNLRGLQNHHGIVSVRQVKQMKMQGLECPSSYTPVACIYSNRFYTVNSMIHKREGIVNLSEWEDIENILSCRFENVSREMLESEDSQEFMKFLWKTANDFGKLAVSKDTY